MNEFNFKEFYQATDKMDAKVFASYFSPQGTMTFANNDPVSGQDAIAGLADSIYQQLEGIEHEFKAVHAIENGYVVEGTVIYHKKTGTKISLKFAAFTRLNEQGKIVSHDAYLDPSPFFEA